MGLSPLKADAGSLFVSTSNREVGSIDEETGVYTSILDSPTFTDVALDADNDLWGITFGSLYSVDLGAKTTNFVGSLGATLNGLGFDAAGTLYGTGRNGFYSINTSTGSASRIASLSGFSSSGDLVYDADLELFWATSSGDSLWTITKDGIAAKVGDIGFRNVYGLAFGDDGTLFGYTASRDQIVLDLETGAGTFVQKISGANGQIWGSASEPTDGSLTAPTTSTPEPSIIVGLAAFGLIAYCKRYEELDQA